MKGFNETAINLKKIARMQNKLIWCKKFASFSSLNNKIVEGCEILCSNYVKTNDITSCSKHTNIKSCVI